MWQFFFRDFATHFEPFPDQDYDSPLDDSFHINHEQHVGIKQGDWFSIFVEGEKVHLSVNGVYYGVIIDDKRIKIGEVYPVITFGSADGDKIGLLPVDKEMNVQSPQKGKENVSPAKGSPTKQTPQKESPKKEQSA